MTASSPFMEMIRGEIRLRCYSIRTEKSYLFWIKQYILFHEKKHPNTMGAGEVKAFLTWLAVTRSVAVNTQKVALSGTSARTRRQADKLVSGRLSRATGSGTTKG